MVNIWEQCLDILTGKKITWQHEFTNGMIFFIIPMPFIRVVYRHKDFYELNKSCEVSAVRLH